MEDLRFKVRIYIEEKKNNYPDIFGIDKHGNTEITLKDSIANEMANDIVSFYKSLLLLTNYDKDTEIIIDFSPNIYYITLPFFSRFISILKSNKVNYSCINIENKHLQDIYNRLEGRYAYGEE